MLSRSYHSRFCCLLKIGPSGSWNGKFWRLLWGNWSRRLLSGILLGLSSSLASSGGVVVDGTSQSSVGGATHRFRVLSNTNIAGHLCNLGYPPWHAQYRLQDLPSGTFPFASSLQSGCFWHPPTFWGQSHACVSSLYKSPPTQCCSVEVPFQQVQYRVHDVSWPKIPYSQSQCSVLIGGSENYVVIFVIIMFVFQIFSNESF